MEDLVSGESVIPFNPELIASEEMADFTKQEIAVNSNESRRFKVILTVPKDRKGPFPAEACIHGHGANRRTVYESDSPYKAFAWHLAEKGYVTISTDVG